MINEERPRVAAAAMLYVTLFVGGVIVGNSRHATAPDNTEQTTINEEVDKNFNDVYLQITILGRQITTLTNRELWEENPELQKRMEAERAKYADPGPVVEPSDTAPVMLPETVVIGRPEAREYIDEKIEQR